MRIDATIQARTGSSRLPGKVLLPILGKPMLAHHIERIRQSLLIDRIIVATSTAPEDDAIEELAEREGVLCFRGSEDDVLGRVVGACQMFDVDLHVEFQGDCPLVDPLLVDSVIGFYLKHADECDYVSNAVATTFPPGSEMYVYPAKVLYAAETKATPEMREHVGANIYTRPEHFRLLNIPAPPAFHYPDMYLEVDTPEDFAVVSRVFEHFYPTNPRFGLLQIIDFMLAEKGLADSNRDVPRRWKEFREENRG